MSAVAVVALAAAALAAAPNGGAGAAPAEAPEKAGLYIVQAAGEPAASYDGGVAGFARTKPAGRAELTALSWLSTDGDGTPGPSPSGS